jgi:hypothetical protein
MKKIIILTVILSISAVIVKAQSPRFGFNAGISLADITYKDGIKVKTDSRVGLNIGAVMDIPVGSNFSVQPGVNFIQKGAKEKQSDGTNTEEYSSIINYLEVPLNIVYKAPIKKGHIFLGAGPSAGYALNGKVVYKYTGPDGSETSKEKYSIGNKNEDDLKPLELGLNVMGGYEFRSGLLIAINYNRSLNNLLPGDVENESLKNSYFGFKIGYMFGKKNK